MDWAGIQEYINPEAKLTGKRNVITSEGVFEADFDTKSVRQVANSLTEWKEIQAAQIAGGKHHPAKEPK